MSLSEPAPKERLNPLIWRVALVALCGALLAQIDATIVNVSLSSLAFDLGVRFQQIQWVVSGYLLALVFAIPLTGWLVERVGAKSVYLGGFAAFTGASVCCGLAWSAPVLIGFRVLQGLCGGVLIPMAQMMIARTAGAKMTKVAGIMSVPVLLAPVFGPVLAGMIVQHLSWRWLFFVNIPIGCLGFLLAVWLLPPEKGNDQPKALDWAGLALLSPGLALLLYGTTAITSVPGIITLIAGAALIVTFICLARQKGAQALIDPRLFCHTQFSCATAIQFLSNGVLFASQVLIPAYLITVCSRSPSQAGALLTAMGLGMMVTFPLTGWLCEQFGIRRVAASGAWLAAIATLPLIFLTLAGYQAFILVIALFLRGAGMSAVSLPAMTAAYSSVSKAELPMATTSVNLVQRLGGPVITTLFTLILAWQTTAKGTPSPDTFMWSFVLLCLLNIGIALIALRLPRQIAD
ncbi:MAG: DHA2 family efflux MFS transporter permease subunit [Pantoea sp.]|uniref:DHA2 family efflux MFS transporter permease subunit n=1 Tax=Pantoea sp. TaxID=69393 RepID=UPI0039E39B67